MTDQKQDPPAGEQGAAPEAAEGAEATEAQDKVKAALERDLVSDPEMFNRVYEQRTVTGAGAFAGGDGPIPRSYHEFIMDHTICASGFFPGDFKIKLRSLTSAEEMEAVRGADDPMMVATMLSKASIHAVNGTPLDEDKRTFLWEALTSAGRQVVQSMFAQAGYAPARALGKATASSTID